MLAELDAKEKTAQRTSRNHKVMENLGLVYMVLGRFRDRGYDMEELFQIGTEGLIKAAERFEPERGYAFSTYAVPVITGEIQRFIRDDGMIHISRQVKQNARVIMMYRESFAKKNQREPRILEIQNGTGLSEEDILMAMDAPFVCDSLHGSGRTEEDAEGRSMEELLPSPELPQEKVVEKVALEQLLMGLEETERRLLVLRYQEGLSQMETAKRLEMNQVAVSRMEKRVLLKLRKCV